MGKRAMFCYNRAKSLFDMNDIGHSWMHSNMSIEDMNKRLENEHGRHTISSFTISHMELLEQMEFAVEDNAEDIEKWLFNKPQENKHDIKFDCDKSIGKLISDKSWCDRQNGHDCSQLIIVLKRICDYNLGHDSFIIITEYCDLTDEEKSKIKGYE